MLSLNDHRDAYVLSLSDLLQVHPKMSVALRPFCVLYSAYNTGLGLKRQLGSSEGLIARGVYEHC